MRDILLTVPTRGQIQWATVTRLEQLRDGHDMLPIVYQPGNLSVAQTRNRIVERFLAGPCDVLAMVDDDVVPPPYFLELAEHLDEFGMVAAPHPMPHPAYPSQLILSAFDESLTPAAINLDGVEECAYVATGAVLIRRDVIERLSPNPFRIADDPDAEIVSDDFLFCDDLREADYKIGYAIREGWYSDHHATVSLAPLFENRLVTS